MGKVLGMHKLDLKPGVDIAEFEEFICNDVLPLYQKIPGQTAYLCRGDRGERLEKYLLVIEIESPELRDKIYPPGEDRLSDEFHDILKGTEPIWGKMDSFISAFPDPTYTDYIIVKD